MHGDAGGSCGGQAIACPRPQHAEAPSSTHMPAPLEREQRAVPIQVHGPVVYHVPDGLRQRVVAAALRELGGLDQLFQHGRPATARPEPARADRVVGAHDDATVLGAERDREYPAAPRVPGRVEGAAPEDAGQVQAAAPDRPAVPLSVEHPEVATGMDCLLLGRVGGLRHGRHLPRGVLPHASDVAVPHGEDDAVAPGLAVARDHLQEPVDEDPPAAPGAPVAERVRRHVGVRALDTRERVDLVEAVHQPAVVRVVLHTVLGLDALVQHVLLAVSGRGLGERAQAARQAVGQGDLQLGEEEPELAGPLHTHEPGADDEDPRLLLVQNL
mmetsp:Transcript_78409/g.221774  ORF Transcript_78409/g.221774 Transcript_78409/m.221774 type:complete len:328 (+) Transcript_78409:42-1025(+)